MTARAVFSEARLLKLLALAREQGLQPSTVSDACVLISMLLQRGARLAEIGHSLATAPLWGGEDVPASPVGAIVAEMRAEEGEV